MSLVGSLEDLALGDILQIVSLSRKSGLLLLRTDSGDGRIFFHDGLVQAAYVKGEPEDLPALVVAGGFADRGVLEAELAAAPADGRSRQAALSECTGLSEERLLSLCREHVERCVLQMFGWGAGEFSFEVSDRMQPRDGALALASGISAQYLTLEASRLGDEVGDPGDDGLVLSGEDSREAGEENPHQALATATAARVPEEPGALAVPAGAPVPEAATREVPASAARLPLVVIDPELTALEWVKSQLEGIFARVHIFQHSGDGISRVRQYLSRAELPVVLVSTAARADRLTGSSDVAELLGRLRSQAPRMPILALHEDGCELPAGVDAADSLVTRPRTARLADPRCGEQTRASGEELAVALGPWAFPSEQVVAPPSRPAATRPRRRAAVENELRALEEVSERLRDPSTRGEVLSLVLDFAASRFRRVAMFVVTDDEAIGMAQRGLSEAGGPDDEAFCALRVPLMDAAWFRSVVERGESLRAGPSDEGDRRLAARLGNRAPVEAFLAPIEAGGRVAVLLYGDNLPETGPIGDTTIAAIVLHEAGLALERAVLDRALEAPKARG